MRRAESIYLLTGRDETFADLPGAILKKVGVSFGGREYCHPFSRLSFAAQLDIITQDLLRNYWHSRALLIARSYGAYLLLHALSHLSEFPGDVLLFAPILGMALAANGHYGVIPPRASFLSACVMHGKFPSCRSLQIHLGEVDDGCSCEHAEQFIARMPFARLVKVFGCGHHFPQDYYERTLHPLLDIQSLFEGDKTP